MKHFAWRHWGCLTPRIIENMKKTFGEGSELDGYEELRPKDQAKVIKAWHDGHVANMDIPESTRKPADEDGAEKPKKVKRAPAEKKATDSDGEAEERPKKKAKFPIAKKAAKGGDDGFVDDGEGEDEDEEEEEPKKKRAPSRKKAEPKEKAAPKKRAPKKKKEESDEESGEDFTKELDDVPASSDEEEEYEEEEKPKRKAPKKPVSEKKEKAKAAKPKPAPEEKADDVDMAEGDDASPDEGSSKKRKRVAPKKVAKPASKSRAKTTSVIMPESGDIQETDEENPQTKKQLYFYNCTVHLTSNTHNVTIKDCGNNVPQATYRHPKIVVKEER